MATNNSRPAGFRSRDDIEEQILDDFLDRVDDAQDEVEEKWGVNLEIDDFEVTINDGD